MDVDLIVVGFLAGALVLVLAFSRMARTILFWSVRHPKRPAFIQQDLSGKVQIFPDEPPQMPLHMVEESRRIHFD